MNIILIAAIAVLSVFTLALLVFHIRSRRPLRSILLNAALGIAALIIINLTSRFTGVHIPINWFSVGGSGIFGLPAVFTLLILQMII